MWKMVNQFIIIFLSLERDTVEKSELQQEPVLVDAVWGEIGTS